MDVTMDDLELIKQRASFLVQARHKLNEEYQARRNEQYAKWQLESQQLWITKGIILPNPGSYTYPSEKEVVARALELYNKHNKTELTEFKEPDPITDVEPKTDIEQKPAQEPNVIQEPAIEPTQTPAEAEADMELVKVLKENSTLRSLLAQFVSTAKKLSAETPTDKDTP
jgi:hypothetical protein